MLLARIGAAQPPVFTVWPADIWRLDRVGNHWQVHAQGWHALNRQGRLDRLKLLLDNAAFWPESQTLVWEASKIELDRATMLDCHRTWTDTGDPPVLSFIALDFGAQDAEGRGGITSKGLAIIAGVEVEALASGNSLRRQSILVARMVAHLLKQDVPASGEVKDPEGATMRFQRRQPGHFSANSVICFDLPLGIDMDQ